MRRKSAERQRERVARLKARTAFIDGIDSCAQALDRVKAEQRKAHWSLHRIVEILDDQEIPASGLEEQVGLTGGRRVYFNGNDPNYEALFRPNDGGVTVAFRDTAGQLKTVIFLRSRRELPQDGRRLVDLLQIGVLLHEAGHVDDWETQANLREGGEIDLAAAELYAHNYACKRLISGNFVFSSGAYLDGVKQQLTTGCDANEMAAASFLQSELGIRFQRFVQRGLNMQLVRVRIKDQQYQDRAKA